MAVVHTAGQKCRHIFVYRTAGFRSRQNISRPGYARQFVRVSLVTDDKTAFSIALARFLHFSVSVDVVAVNPVALRIAS